MAFDSCASFNPVIPGLVNIVPCKEGDCVDCKKNSFGPVGQSPFNKCTIDESALNLRPLSELPLLLVRARDDCLPEIADTLPAFHILYTMVKHLEETAFYAMYINSDLQFSKVHLFINRNNLHSLAEKIIGGNIAHGCQYVILAHQCQARDPMPRKVDKLLKQYVSCGLGLIDATILDYIIAGDSLLFSSALADIMNHHYRGQLQELYERR